MTNHPFYITEHSFDSDLLGQTGILKVRTQSKLMNANQIVGFTLQSIICSNIAADERVTDQYCIVKWCDTEICRIAPDEPGISPVWSDMSITFNAEQSKLTSQELKVEIWVNEAMDRSMCVGSVKYTGSALAKIFIPGMGEHWNELKKVGSSTSQEELKCMIRLVGTVVSVDTTDLETLGTMYPLYDDETNLLEEEMKINLVECHFGIIKARDLALTGFANSCEPVCTVFLNGDEIGRTGVATPGQEPEFGDMFKLQLPEDKDHLELYNLTVEVWNSTSFGRGEFLGCTELTGKRLSSFIMSSKIKKVNLIYITTLRTG